MVDGAASVTIAEVLELRASGLTEAETWALLCQASQALQDLFLSKTPAPRPGVCPCSLRVSCRGRVRLAPGRVSRDVFLAPELAASQRDVSSDQQLEKMWIYSVGRTLKEAAGQGQLSRPLDGVLTAMTLQDPRRRASLMDVLDVISEYCKTRQSPKPFSHVTMDLYREVLGSPTSPVTQCLPNTTSSTPLSHTAPRADGHKSKSTTQICKSSSMKEFRRNPVQRAPSRLYRAVSSIATHPQAKYTCPNTCIGPEFVVRASSPSKRVQMADKSRVTRQVTVVLLTGQKLDIFCDPGSVTAGQVYETVLQVERLEENYFLGLAALIAGDFVFLAGDLRLGKLAPRGWRATTLTLYLRVKFFLPSLRGVRRWTTKHLMYLQLRRSLLERQIRCDVADHVALGGLALQAEFGDFDESEHGSGDYFIVDHYIPETQLADEPALRCELQRLHRSRHGLDPGRAEEMYVTQAQQLNHYGAHFYCATAVSKSRPPAAVFLAVSGQGISLFDEQRQLTDFFVWRSIQKLCYTKQFFVLHPCGDGKGLKHKFSMELNKSLFVFQLASLHHQFFMKLRIELSSLQSLSVEFGVPLRRFGRDNKRLFYLLDKPPSDEVPTPPARQVAKPTTPEEFQNKENEGPEPESYSSLARSTASDSSLKATCPRRVRVKMGTRAFLATPRELFASQDTVTSPPSRDPMTSSHMKTSPPSRDAMTSSPAARDPMTSSPAARDLTSSPLSRDMITSSPAARDMTSSPLSRLMTSSPGSTRTSPLPEAYVLNSSIKSTDERFHLDFHEILSDSLIEKFDNASFADERILRTMKLRRDVKQSLGMQITEGSDGGVYVQSVTPGGAAALTGTIHTGDQLIAVDGHTLLNLKYHEALHRLQSTGTEVELVFSQVFSGESANVGDHHYPLTPQPNGRRYSSGVDLLSDILQKPIEDSYLRNIRYETAVELDGDGNEMVSSPIPRRVSRGWRSPPNTTLRAVCCVMPLDDDDTAGHRRNGFL